MIEFKHLQKTDPEVYNLIMNEYDRQNNCLELIASENEPSESVLEAQASYHTLKYAEGYPGKRYYAGCRIIDQTEQLAIDRVCQLFKCNYANVQPHSGASANTAVQFALAQPGDTIMGMSLNSGRAPNSSVLNQHFQESILNQFNMKLMKIHIKLIMILLKIL